MRNTVGGFLGTEARHHFPHLNSAVAINSLNQFLLLIVFRILQLTLHVPGVKKELALPGFVRAVGALPGALFLHAIHQGTNMPAGLPVMKLKAIHRALETQPNDIGAEHLRQPRQHRLRSFGKIAGQFDPDEILMLLNLHLLKTTGDRRERRLLRCPYKKRVKCAHASGVCCPRSLTCPQPDAELNTSQPPIKAPFTDRHIHSLAPCYATKTTNPLQVSQSENHYHRANEARNPCDDDICHKDVFPRPSVLAEICQRSCQHGNNQATRADVVGVAEIW